MNSILSAVSRHFSARQIRFVTCKFSERPNFPHTKYLEFTGFASNYTSLSPSLTFWPLGSSGSIFNSKKQKLCSDLRSVNRSSMATEGSSSALLQIESAKKAAAFKAVDDHLLPTHKYVGIGSGSTVVYVVDAISRKGTSFYQNMSFVPTGSQSKSLIRKAGLKLCNLDERPAVNGMAVRLDVAFDGADEIDEDLNLIKGGGACLFQEKLVAVAANKFIAVADSRKQSPRLCTTWKAIPIEVLPMAAPDVLSSLKQMGSMNPLVRAGLPAKAGECVTDNGMWIIDAPFPPLLLPQDLSPEEHGDGKSGQWEIKKLAEELVQLPGVVEIGLFYGVNGNQASGGAAAQKPVAAYFGMPDGSIHVQNAA